MTGGILRANFCAALLVSIAFGWTQSVMAALMVGGAYEPFDYPVGTAITQANSLNGGGGWDTPGNTNAPNHDAGPWGAAIGRSTPPGHPKSVQRPTLTSRATWHHAEPRHNRLVEGSPSTA